MIKLEVTSIDGQLPSKPLAADFDESGGTIGRAEGCTLHLPDPDRIISRRHAEIFLRAGRYLIRDTGSAAPVLLNGQVLGRDRESPLAPGDELRIGRYVLQVRPAAQALGQPLAPPVTAGRTAGPTKDDPLALFGRGAVSDANPLADLLGPASAAETGHQAGAPGAFAPASVIPDDFDPFAEPPAPPAPPALGQEPAGPRRADASEPTPPRALIPEDFDLGLGSTTGRSVDEVFGLDRPASGAGPLDSLLTPPRSGGFGAQRDDAPELHAAFVPPPAPGAPPSLGQGPPDAPGPVVSWEGEPGRTPGELRTVVIPSHGARPLQTPAARGSDDHALVSHAPPVAGSAGSTNAPIAAPVPAAGPAPMPAPAASAGATSYPPAASTPPADASPPAALLRAFLAGAGVPTLDIPGGLTPQLMERLGRLLRESTQGTLDLLVARAIAKRALRAQVTMIVARGNNPLKFSPTVEAALAHLLAPAEGHGFLPPLAAMHDAYDDLRAHQFAVMAGMRAALAGVLARFDPAQLEQRLIRHQVIDAVLPMARKARLWEMFEELFAQLSTEAQEDFHELFGREFLRAYEEELVRLERRAPQSDPAHGAFREAEPGAPRGAEPGALRGVEHDAAQGPEPGAPKG